MVERGIFREGERVELIGGIITSMMGEGYAHADAVDRLADALKRILPPDLAVRVRTRLDVLEDTEAYPDVLVENDSASARDRSPANVHLLVEVSDSSLAADRKVKAAEYAQAGFREYWVVGLRARRLWVHRNPSGGKWASVSEFGEEGTTPLFAPDRTVALTSVFPA